MEQQEITLQGLLSSHQLTQVGVTQQPSTIINITLQSIDPSEYKKVDDIRGIKTEKMKLNREEENKRPCNHRESKTGDEVVEHEQLESGVMMEQEAGEA